MTSNPVPPSTRAIHAVLRQDVITLRLGPGTRLSENELAERFGTSRAPVREALIRLAEEGLIDVLPQRGSFVSRIPMTAILRAWFVREALEVAAVRRAAEALPVDARAIESAHAAIADQRRAGEDPVAFTLADEAFHHALAAASAIPNLWTVVEREKAPLDRVRFLSLPASPRATPIVAEHEAILAAILAGDAEAAASAMRAHLGTVLERLPALARAHPDLIVADTAPPGPERGAAD